MGRSPCCDKQSVRKGTWSAEEDDVLKSYIETNGTATNWIVLPKKIGLNRCGKSCRLRWLNYLRPNIKHDGFSQEEDDIILQMYVTIGTRWSVIAERLPGRTDNDIKNRWNTKLHRKLIGKQKMSKRHRFSYGGFLQDYNHVDYINNPNSTNFTITNNHLMLSHWTQPTPQNLCTRPLSNTISFASTSCNCNPTINGVGSSSSMQVQQGNMSYNHNEGNVKLDDILREIEASLLGNDEVDNNVKDVSSYGESIGSLDFGDSTFLISFSMDELDEYINWEQISLPEDDLI